MNVTVKRQKIGMFLLFLVPCMVYIFVWRIAPLFYTVYLSFTSFNLVQQSTPRFTGIQNYQNILLDPLFLNSLRLTFILMVGATAGELILGLTMALLVNREFRATNTVRSAFLVPMMITPIVVGTIWYILYHDLIGPINYFLSLLGVQRINWLGSESTALLSIIIADIWQWTPFMFLLLLSALQIVPKQLYEAAQIDGASSGKLFRCITLPMILDTLLIAVVLRSMDAFRVFDKVFIMTGGGPANATEVASVLVYKSAFMFFKMGYAAALVVILLVILATLYSIYVRLMKF